MRTHEGGGRLPPQAQRRGARPGARQTCWKRVKGGTHRGDYVQPSVRRGGCRTAWLISPGSMMDEPWHMPKSCCCRCYCCWHSSELAKLTHSFVFCLLPFPLSFFLSFHSVCHSINPNSSLFFVFVSPAISDRVLLRVRMLYYLRQEVIGDHADRILEGTDSRLASLSFPSTESCCYLSSPSITFSSSSSPFLTTPPRCACIYNVQTCSPC